MRFLEIVNTLDFLFRFTSIHLCCPASADPLRQLLSDPEELLLSSLLDCALFAYPPSSGVNSFRGLKVTFMILQTQACLNPLYSGFQLHLSKETCFGCGVLRFCALQ